MRRSVLLFLLLSSACVHQRQVRTQNKTLTTVADPFRAPIGEGFVRTTVASESSKYVTSRVEFPARNPTRDENRTMGMTLRRPNGTPRGLIVVLPILGGDYGPSEGFAIAFAEAGFTTLRFDRKTKIFDPERDFEHVATMMTEGVVDIRRGLGWALKNRLAGRGKVGLLGISMGSFVGTLIAATDPRIDATILALGGGDLPEILHVARGEREIDALFDGLEGRGWSADRIRTAATRDLAQVEPMNFAPAIDPRTTLLVHARFDGVVPFSNGTKIWSAMHKPDRLVLLTGHYTSAFLWPWLVDAMNDHFTTHLDPLASRRSF